MNIPKSIDQIQNEIEILEMQKKNLEEQQRQTQQQQLKQQSKSIEQQFWENWEQHSPEIEAKLNEAYNSINEAVQLGIKYCLPVRFAVSGGKDDNENRKLYRHYFPHEFLMLRKQIIRETDDPDKFYDLFGFSEYANEGWQHWNTSSLTC